jgi:apolipoprotein N-acyltransferase
LNPQSFKLSESYSRLLIIFSAITLGLTFNFILPATIFTIISFFLLAFGICFSNQLARDLWIFGSVVLGTSAFWLVDTITTFGEMPRFLSWVLFLLFVLLSGIPYFCIGFLSRKLSRKILPLELAVAISWFALDTYFPSLFPWRLTSILVPENSSFFVPVYQTFGAEGASAILLYFILSLTSSIIAKKLYIAVPLSFLLLLTTIFFIPIDKISDGKKIKVALLQGNVDPKDKRAAFGTEAGIFPYRELARQIQEPVDLVVLPESVIAHWLPQDYKELRGTEFDALPEIDLPVLAGGLTYRRKTGMELQVLVDTFQQRLSREELNELSVEKFNSAIFIGKKHDLLGVYSKRALMPFGEYLPGSKLIPEIKRLSPVSGDFTPGKGDPILELQGIKFTPLICYEDLVSDVALEGAQKGSRLLVNLTNDGWYGRSNGLKQHQTLAQWRAIETGIPLIRVTNTGLSSVIDSNGKIVQTLTPFEKGMLITEIPLTKVITPYLLYGKIPTLFSFILFYLSFVIDRNRLRK